MTRPNPNYEFIIEEGKVYRIRAYFGFNVKPAIQITGTGTVTIKGSILTPSSINDPILTTSDADTNITGFKQFLDALPNYLKVEESAVGTRVVTLSGFSQPELIF
jgi:hypothetical protein